MDDDFVVVDRADISVVAVPSEHVVTSVVESPSVVSTENTSVVATEETSTSVVAAGQQGPEGPPGQSDTLASFIAGQNLSGHRMVVLENHQAVYASNDDLSHAQRVVGLTTGAALTGDMVTVMRSRELQEPSWSWVVGEAIYLGSGGALLQSPPVSPALFSLCVGFATATDRMYISVGTPIILA